MSDKEATARIKINKLLEAAGWRFFAEGSAPAKPDEAEAIPAIKNFFKAYATSNTVRGIIESGHFTDLATNPYFSTRDFTAVPAKYRALIPSYIKDYVSLNQFAP